MEEGEREARHGNGEESVRKDNQEKNVDTITRYCLTDGGPRELGKKEAGRTATLGWRCEGERRGGGRGGKKWLRRLRLGAKGSGSPERIE